MRKETPLDFLDYPCQFPLKVVGKNIDDFEHIVSQLVRQHVAEQHDIHIKKNPSKKENFVSLTLTFDAHSREQLEKIYQCLYDCPEVMMTL